MSQSTFDPTAFEEMTIDQSNEVKMTPVPEGDYRGIIQGVKIDSVSISKGDRAGQTVPVLKVTYELEDDTGKLKELLNRDKITVRQDIWLDISDNGSLAFGPNLNVGLGRLRDACNMNKPGKPFSFKMLEGAGPVIVHVIQDTRDEDVYNRVPKVSRVE